MHDAGTLCSHLISLPLLGVVLDWERSAVLMRSLCGVGRPTVHIRPGSAGSFDLHFPLSFSDKFMRCAGNDMFRPRPSAPSSSSQAGPSTASTSSYPPAENVDLPSPSPESAPVSDIGGSMFSKMLADK